MSLVKNFPIEVIDKIKNYVYRLIDPRNGRTFYIGKGKGNRVFRHMFDELDAEDKAELKNQLKTIREIRNSGLEVIHVIHRHGMDESTVRVVESALIDAYPEADNAIKGIHSHEYGPMNASQIINRYAAMEAEFKHNLLMITVNDSINERSIYDATRFAWKIGKRKLDRIQYVLAIDRGIIIEVFKPEEWKRATKINFPEFNAERASRIGFIGSIAESAVRDLYIRKRVPQSYRPKGASNPIRYTF